MESSDGAENGRARSDGKTNLLALLSPWGWLDSDHSLAARAILTAIWTANVVLMAITIVGLAITDVGYDWNIFVEAGQRVASGDLYVWDEAYAWSYSPLLAHVFAVIAPIGFVGWSLLHVMVLALIRDWWLAAVALLSWPFWADVYNGNTMVFVVVAAVGAMNRSSLATGSYLLLWLLMPRPLMLPLLVWVLWQQPAWRIRFFAMVAANAVLVLASGYGAEWFNALRGVQDAVGATSRDIGPANIIGAWWVPIGAVAAVILTLRGRIGWASLAASPYWLPQYLLILVLDFARPRPRPIDP